MWHQDKVINAINLRQHLPPPSSSNFYYKEEEKIEHITNFRRKWQLGISKVCNWVKNWPQNYNKLSKRFREHIDFTLGNCRTESLDEHREMKHRVLSEARRGEDNVFLKQIQERKALSVLRIHLISHRSKLPYPVYFHWNSVLKTQ